MMALSGLLKSIGGGNMPHECARCDHWCEEGIKFRRKGQPQGYFVFKCSDCKHETTMVKMDKDEVDSYE